MYGPTDRQNSQTLGYKERKVEKEEFFCCLRLVYGERVSSDAAKNGTYGI